MSDRGRKNSRIERKEPTSYENMSPEMLYNELQLLGRCSGLLWLMAPNNGNNEDRREDF